MELVDSTTTRNTPVARTMAAVPRQNVGPRRRPERITSGAGPMRRFENGTVIWRVQCGDFIDRDRCLTVFVEAGKVVVNAPPGETGRLTADQTKQLRAALNEASRFAQR